MGALKPLWDAKQLAIVHAAGSPDTTRSHFDAQDYMESGTPGLKGTEDGWLNRAVAEREAERSTERNAAELSKKEEKPSPFRAIALGPTLPRILLGKEPAVAINSINEFGVG